MSWFPVDDAFHGHPKGRKAGLEAIGLWTICGSYSMAYLTDGFVPEWFVKEKPRGLALAKRLIDAGLWKIGDSDGEKGYWFHEWRTENTKEQVLAARRAAAARQEVARNPDLRKAIRDRDGDVCQYCGTPVEWNNRRGPTGGTYDHVVPAGGTTLANLVVCCRGCNARKGRRTPEEAEMPLIKPRADLNRDPNTTKNVLNQIHVNPTQPKEEQKSTLSDPDGSDHPKSDYPQAFEDWWDRYPRKDAKRKALEAWRRARKRATDQELNDAALRYAQDPNRQEQFTKQPATWLNGDCWLSDALPNTASILRAVGSPVDDKVNGWLELANTSGRELE